MDKEISIIKPKIKRVKVKNIGVIKNADITFKDGLNIIKGNGGTGKTTLLNAIKCAFQKEEHIYRSKDGEIEVELFSKYLKQKFSNEKKIEKSTNELSIGKRTYFRYMALKLDGDETILIDDALSRLDNKITLKILKRFVQSNSQIILVGNQEIPTSLNPKIIDAKDFKLKM